MRTRRVRALSGLVVALLFAPVARAVSPADFPCYKELRAPAQVGGGFGRVVLDQDILSQINASRTNIRFFDEEGKEVPFLLRVTTGTTNVVRETEFSVRTESFKELPGNCAEIVVSRQTNDPVPNVVVLRSSQQNFEKSVSVAGSDDRQHWTALADDQSIFDYTRYIDVRKNRIDIAPQGFRFYRIMISNMAENRSTGITEIIRQARGGSTTVTEKETAEIRKELFRVDRITMVARGEVQTDTEPLLQSMEISPFQVETDPKQQQTFVTFMSRREPLVALDIRVKDSNFSRRAKVSATDEDPQKAHWIHLASAMISRIEAGSVRQDAHRIELRPACRYTNYRLAIENHDNPPLTIESVHAQAETWEAVFYQQKPTPRSLYYGGPNNQPAQYDIGAVLSGVPAKDAPCWSLGAEMFNPLFKPARTYSLQGKTLMVVAIVAMALLLVMLIARTTGQVDQAGKE